MSDDEILSPGMIDGLRRVGSLYGIDGGVARSHEALRSERDLYRSIAERAADMWQPTFGLNPDEGLWVFPWAEDVADEAMTPEQVAWYRKRRESRT
jgi:hypothetical protein